MEVFKPDLSRCNRLLDDGFSLITVNENKIPNIRWKEYQSSAMKKDTFENFYSLPTSAGVGIVCGFSDLEVIDVDLKVFHSVNERTDFWFELMSLMTDNIQDFQQKVVIVKTRNNGFHMLYKCKEIAGNCKIAKLKGHNEAIIESRGRGGYVWIYDIFIQGKSYADIQYISEQEREIIWQICKMFNYIEPEEIKPSKEIEIQHFEAEVKIWDDFNNKNRVIDLLGSEFQIIKRLTDKTVIRRNGATSPHSGYIYHDKDFLYLWSTGTQYPHQKALRSFDIYSIQKHFGDIKATCKDLYHQGYGSRIKPIIEKQNKKHKSTEQSENNIQISDFPLEVYPDFIQRYLKEVSDTLSANIDFLGCGFLWCVSLCVGNTIKIEIKKGWQEAAILWIALVGRAGVGKTHTIKAVTFPLEKLNGREIKRYSDMMQKYEAYIAMTKKEKQEVEEIKKPKKTKFIAEDITIEALSELHEANPNAIGILKDELVGWIKDMNKYREGSDLQKYLSCWSNGVLSSDRKTSGSNYVEHAYLPIIGGVQPSILTGVYTPENKDNGFIDRILISYPEINVEHYNDKEISEKLLNEYDEFVSYMFDNLRNALRYDDYGNINPIIIRLSDEAKNEWKRVFNRITDSQNSDNENEYIKSVLPKMKSYIARFSLILEVLYSFSDEKQLKEINKKSVLNAEKLADYFINMAKKNKFNSMEHQELIETIKYSGKRTAFEKFKAIYETGKKLNKSKIAEELNVSRQTVTNWENELKSVKQV